ncbi:MAG: ribosomal protein S18-alanine N-acetyltransferase [Nitrospirota bacterium]
MHTIVIREMSPEDIPEVILIERRSFTTPWSETSFHSELYNRYSITRVAELNHKIIGYICVRQIADECHLMDLAVHPDYRRQGVAVMLFNNVLQDTITDGCRFMYLEVRVSNQAAKKLYEKLGFKIIGIRKNYYVNPTENAFIMMRELSPPIPA